MKTPTTFESERLFSLARQYIPGGVNSPVRAFRAVGGTPRFIRSASGCNLIDADQNSYLDFVGSWGPLILGHAHPEVVQAIQETAARGTSFGAPTQAEVELAQKISALIPSVEKVRLVNSGTEATMTSLRLARAYTGRSKVIKFDGCYHGHSESFLVRAGSGVATLGLPDSPGVPSEFTANTVSLPFNDWNLLEETVRELSQELAAIILEPVTGNMGVVVPEVQFLKGLLNLARKVEAIVIFDEVMTGFRLAPGGAQELFGLQPDLTCMGKIVGGGLPLAAVGGRADIMEQLAPEGTVYQAGTLSGNPLAVAAGLKTLEILERENPYRHLDQLTRSLCQGMRKAAESADLKVQVTRCGSMFTLFFAPHPVTDFASAKRSNIGLYSSFFQECLKEGLYFPPSQFEACFLSTAHTEAVVEETLEKVERVFGKLSSLSRSQT